MPEALPAARSRPVRLATRGSPLARWQAQRVADLLRDGAGVTVDTVVVSTAGDRRTDVSLDRIGGQGVFVKEVQAAVLDGRADAAVHSAKDLPARTPEGLVLASVPERADPRDALVGSTLDGLGPGGPVATGSVRRRAQLAWLRPDLTFVDLRGNLARRIERAEHVGAGVVAAAALVRLGLQASAAEVVEPDRLLPQVGQGALAVECRADDEEVRALLSAIDDGVAHRELRAERAFLARLGGGCTLPVAGLARVAADGEVVLEGMLASRDGRVMLRRVHRGTDPEALGAGLAEALVDTGGGRSLLDWETEIEPP